jgi:predicted ribosome quality control (RQC) complex YloA/Tae2 family protein
LRTALVAGENYCKKNLQRLEEVKQDDHYRLWADLIMANLHTIKGDEEKIVVPNYFQNDQSPQEIRLKKSITPQKNAELYYRKAKNQHIEIARLEASMAQKQEEMKALRHQIATVEKADDLKTLRGIRVTIRPEQEKNESRPLPYHEFEFKGYRILVGKNAQANDTLTSKYGHKEDLWLHAKDVSGSHVLIKYQSGKNFPKDVIEYAASLAAYNSKRRNESLCPVIVTPKKFVRKRKGDPPGAVVVEREDVIMVAPARIN